MKKFALVAMVSALMLIGTTALTQGPVRNVSGSKHPDLAAAQKATNEAWNKLSAAQKSGEWDTAGHAQKAKDLLESASNELKLSIEAAEKNPAK